MDPLSRTRYDATSTVLGQPDGSIAHPFLTIQAALDGIGSAADRDEFQDPTLRAWKLVIGPGQYVEDLSIPVRADWTFEVNGVVIVGNVTMAFDWTVYGQSPVYIGQIKLKFVGGDLRNAYVPQTNEGPPIAQIMPVNGISGNVIIDPTMGLGFSLVFQLHFINYGVCGSPGPSSNPPTGTGHIMAIGGTGGNYTTQLFLEDAILQGDFYIGGAINNAGTLYASNTDTSSSASNGGVRGRAILNVLRNVVFTRPVVTTFNTQGRWFAVAFAAVDVANDFSGSTGTILADYNSFVSYFTNVGTKGSNDFTIFDNLAGSTASRPTTELPVPRNRGVMYFHTDLNQPIWRSTSGWVDAFGATA